MRTTAKTEDPATKASADHDWDNGKANCASWRRTHTNDDKWGRHGWTGTSSLRAKSYLTPEEMAYTTHCLDARWLVYTLCSGVRHCFVLFTCFSV